MRGYTVMQGYYGKPEATADAIDADGWLHTGDMVRIREDGHLVFMGRYKDMLKVGGENVSPAEIEASCAPWPRCARPPSSRYPDPRLGEVPVAFVVCEPGARRRRPTTCSRRCRAGSPASRSRGTCSSSTPFR